MGLLDDLLNQAGGASGGPASAGQGPGGLGALMQMVASNPQILQGALALLSTKDTSIGGSGGLAGLVQAFQGKGLGDVVASWIGGGPNQAISGGQLADVLGPETLNQFAAKAGIGAGDAGSVLANVLPMLVNHVTPQGQLPDTSSLEGTLGGLLGGLLK